MLAALVACCSNAVRRMQPAVDHGPALRDLSPSPHQPTTPNISQTRISLNGGANWAPVAPPASYRWAVCNTCKPGAPADQCRLHLHGPTSWFAPEGERGSSRIQAQRGRSRGAAHGATPPALALTSRRRLPLPPAGPRPNFYSHEAAPGLVIATGNVGAHLDFQVRRGGGGGGR